jgi:primosomal protein N' (replication factor Y) (superfamily II helicase)
MWVDVALPVPVPRTFTYSIDATGLTEGMRVRVPFAGRRLIGWITGFPDGSRLPDRVREVDRVLDREPSVTPELLRLCRWIASYYMAPLGIVLRAALPAVLSNRAKTSPHIKTQRVLRIMADLPTLTMRDEAFGRAVRQRECFEVVESLGGSAAVSWLTDKSGFSNSVVRGLVDRGFATLIEQPVLRDPFADIPPPPVPAHTLTAAQVEAVARLTAAARSSDEVTPKPFLLLGVTGSGKTRVYIELLHEIVNRQKKGAIVLVPEISLTPQTVARFRAHFGDTIAVLHSALSDGERYDAWRALHHGDRRIAIGARSAVFAPVRDLGAIVVDEEHEATYKQSESPRYHTREVAIVRAKLSGAVCVLGSATPSLETWNNASVGRFECIELPTRVGDRPLPPVHVIDLRRKKEERSSRKGSLSDELAEAIEARLERNEQCILLLNRRGYSTFVQCRDCGNVWQCRDCNVALTFHRARRRLVCHYCFREEPTPSRCTECGSGDISFLGTGTEQVEREVGERFPAARIARMDVDTTSAKWSHHDILSRVEKGDVDILLGTQMIAKGLDFPNVTLVGVINADIGMNLPDFRASERTFQLLTQVAGRAGRGPLGGEVFIQTALPRHYAVRSALTHDYRTFAAREIEERLPPRYPPHSRLANIIISATEEDAVIEQTRAAADWTRETLLHERLDDVRLTGPAPCPVDRIRGRWRWHFLLRSERPRSLGAICRLIQYRYEPASGRADLRLVLDRDPVTLL